MRFRFILIALTALQAFIFSCSKKSGEQTNSISHKVPDSVYIQTGSKIIAQTFDTLRNSLVQSIGQNGIENAIGFCNENAYTITNMYTDSVKLRRTALRYRNKDNQPDSLELLVLNEMNSALMAKEDPSPQLIHIEGEVHLFKPIILQAMCLNCHGQPMEQIKKPTLDKIKEFYPDDQAVNFNVGELRGAWHVIFKEKEATKIN